MHSSLLKQLGFNSGKELLAAFGVQHYPPLLLKLQLVFTFFSAAALVGFVEQWVWEPPAAALLLVGIDLFNFWYGWQVARKLRKERFSFTKAHETFGVIVSTLVLLAIIHWAILSYDYWKYAADMLFAWLFVFKTRKLLAKMAALKLQSGELGSLIGQWFKTKMAASVVDALQQTPPSHVTPPASPAAEPAVDAVQPTPEA